VRRDKVLQHGQSFEKACNDRHLDDLTDLTGNLLLRFRHQTTHTGKLADLLATTSRPRIHHHEDRVEALAVGA